MKYRVAVILPDGSRNYNQLVFDSPQEADLYGSDLLRRWTLPVYYVVEPIQDTEQNPGEPHVQNDEDHAERTSHGPARPHP